MSVSISFCPGLSPLTVLCRKLDFFFSLLSSCFGFKKTDTDMSGKVRVFRWVCFLCRVSIFEWQGFETFFREFELLFSRYIAKTSFSWRRFGTWSIEIKKKKTVDAIEPCCSQLLAILDGGFILFGRGHLWAASVPFPPEPYPKTIRLLLLVLSVLSMFTGVAVVFQKLAKL